MKETTIRLREFAEDWANTPIDTDVDIRRLNVSLFLDQLMRIIDDGYMSNELVNQEVERRIAERMPSEEEMDAEVDERFPNIENPHIFGKQIGFGDCYFWLRSRLTQKTEGGGE